MKVALFIPIKLNNQRLPGKNIMELNGKPLCSYLFETISELDDVDYKYVYCSDEKIKDYMPSGLTFLKRPARLDGFEIKGLDIIDQFVKDVDADIYILTHVTQPFVKLESFKKALSPVLDGTHDSAFSAISSYGYYWMNGKPINFNPSDIVRTQDLTPLMMETGAFYIFTKEVYTKLHRRVGNNPHIQTIDQFEAIDIDTKEDFEFAEATGLYLAKRCAK